MPKKATEVLTSGRMPVRRRALPRLALAAALLAILPLGACAPLAAPTPLPDADDSRPLVLTTFTVLADLVQVIGGDDVRVVSLTKPGVEIHGYEPTPSDLVLAAEADLVVENGLGLEAWFARFTAELTAPTVTLSAGVEPIAIAVGQAEGHPNPHAWMSTEGASVYVDNAVTALSELVPAASERFAARGAQYKGELRQLGQRLRTAVARIPQAQRILVTCEGAFSYLAREAGLRERYLWAVNQEAQGTPRQMARLIDELREGGPRAIFCESTVSGAAQRRVAEDTDLALGGVLYVDSLSAADGPVPSHLRLLAHDVDVIIAGLTGGEQ